MFDGDETISRDGIDLVVNLPGVGASRWERRELQLLLSNDGSTRIRTSIEYESDLLAKGVSPQLPPRLKDSLLNRGEADAFLANNRFWSISHATPGSEILFEANPDPARRIHVFKDRKVRGVVSAIDVSFSVAEQTIAVATAFRAFGPRDEPTDKVILDVSIYLRQDEFDQLFRYCYLVRGKPDLLVWVDLPCHQEEFERLASERWHQQTFLIEEDASVPVEIRSIRSGRLF
jgi:hypothetical protein